MKVILMLVAVYALIINQSLKTNKSDLSVTSIEGLSAKRAEPVKKRMMQDRLNNASPRNPVFNAWYNQPAAIPEKDQLLFLHPRSAIKTAVYRTAE